jgi:hypothetical protein
MDEDNFADYHTGFRLGTFDKCNGRGDKRADPAYALAWSNMVRDGYSDGFDGNEQRIGEPVRSPLEQLVLEMAAADLCDCEVTIMGNGHYPHAVRNTLEWCQEQGFLTLPPEPDREDVITYAVETWGVNRDDYDWED